MPQQGAWQAKKGFGSLNRTSLQAETPSPQPERPEQPSTGWHALLQPAAEQKGVSKPNVFGHQQVKQHVCTAAFWRARKEN